jgi:hypothetical protein
LSVVGSTPEPNPTTNVLYPEVRRALTAFTAFWESRQLRHEGWQLGIPSVMRRTYFVRPSFSPCR